MKEWTPHSGKYFLNIHNIIPSILRSLKCKINTLFFKIQLMKKKEEKIKKLLNVLV